MKKRNKLFSYFALVLFILSFVSCGDSLKSRLTRRLNNFRKALPAEIKQKFDSGQYEEAGRLLDQKLQQVKSYVNALDSEDHKRSFIRGQYEAVAKEVKALKIPADLLEFNKKFYPVIDYECIPTFTGQQMVDYFKVYFKEKLKTL